ncbi:LysR family transcriptional regulator [Promicromonospora sp. NPDC059942]|uniref:LysR family transcriptional regulator n=1 Tax=Promicromonospora sp. NPDC059942 TaxID=3347009 RepID=UPI0036543744
MELRDIEIFLALAEELHFGRTAERLHVTPSRISHTIKRQERRIGAPLFERTSRVVRLTPLGEQLRDDLLPAHRQIQQAIERAAARACGTAGTLRAGFTTPWCADLLLRAGERFGELRPGWTVQIREIQFDDPYGPLQRGELDLQVVEFPAVGSIVAGPVLFREPRALMVPADHLLARRASVTLEDLAEIPLIVLGFELPRSATDQHLPRYTPLGRPVRRGPSYTFWPEVPALVAAGLGASIVAARAAEFHGRPGIAFVPFSGGPTLDYSVLWHSDTQGPPVPEFVDLLRELAGADGVVGEGGVAGRGAAGVAGGGAGGVAGGGPAGGVPT